ncbi:PIG-L family deacetylase [Mameliella alba]|uniref:PIG-L family deacetylase n=1 Tax=Mameliella alba TaxID=561184 RepID=UPI0018E35FB9|nr:PIG-L family deacetylase [Mameliella alba]MBY6122288.1 PIG-L family deacetylase [Mameliella alba]
MALPTLNGLFTGPLRIDVALQFDTLGGGTSKPLVALGAQGEAPQLVFGQLGASADLYFDFIQGDETYRLVAEDALVAGETATYSAQIDDAGVMSILKDDQPLAQMQAEVPVGLPVYDLTGPATEFDPTVIDLTVEPLSPADPGGDMAIVAHTDDDLLFMNPTIAETIAAGDPMTTVYVTAGDAGQDADYWEAREAGAKAAYAQMAGSDPDAWVDETVTLDIGGEAWEVQSSYLADAPQVRLYFLRTPDGIDGAGTEPYGFGSLELLAKGELAEVTTVDGAVTYTSGELTQVLGAIMTRHAPQEVMLQDDSSEIEHSDHVHTTEFAEAALELYGQNVGVTLYTGYESWAGEENLTPDETALVTSVFETYAAFDPAVTDENGDLREPYTDWVLREYVSEQYSLVDGERVDGPLPEPEPEPEPEEPQPEDPEPEDPTPEDPAPEDPEPEQPPAGDAFSPGGFYAQFLDSYAGRWQGAPPEDPDPEPTPDPTPDPVPGGDDPFGAGGFYEQLMLPNASKWDSFDLPEEEEDDLSEDVTA